MIKINSINGKTYMKPTHAQGIPKLFVYKKGEM